MATLERADLVRLGWPDLPFELQDAVIDTAREALESRVGVRVINELAPAELEQFETLAARSDDAAGLQLLRKVLPDYRRTVDEELQLLRAWLREIGIVVRHIIGLLETSPDPAVSRPSEEAIARQASTMESHLTDDKSESS